MELAALTTDQIDHLLRTHVARRELAQGILLDQLQQIDHSTRRIEQLIDARCKATA